MTTKREDLQSESKTISTIAVLMTCHNRKESTLACLESVYGQRVPTTLIITVILVDDGGTDGTKQAVQERFPEVRVINGNGNLYWAGGMRLAFGEAMKDGYDYYLWLNDDTVLFADAIARLVTASQAIAERAIVIGSTRDPKSGAVTYGGVRRASRWHPLKFKLIPPEDSPVEADTMNGNCVLVPAGVAQALGNLSECFTHAMADIDYGLRAREAGISRCVAPGYAGSCVRNSTKGTWSDPELSIRDRWRKIKSVKGLPPKEWRALARRHGGWAWPFWAVSPYIHMFLARHIEVRR